MESFVLTQGSAFTTAAAYRSPLWSLLGLIERLGTDRPFLAIGLPTLKSIYHILSFAVTFAVDLFRRLKVWRKMFADDLLSLI